MTSYNRNEAGFPARDIERAKPDEIQAARDAHEHNDLEIDAGAEIIRVEGGAWVQAWAWIEGDEYSDKGEEAVEAVRS